MSTILEQEVRKSARAEVEMEAIHPSRGRRGQAYELGMVAVGIALFVYGAFYAEWVPGSTEMATLGLVAMIGGIIPLIAGIVLFTATRDENELATGLTLLGVFALSTVGVTRLLETSGQVTTGDLQAFMGMIFVVWAAVLAYAGSSVWSKHPGFGLTAGVLVLSLLALAIGEWTPSNGWVITAGYGYIIAALIAAGAAVLHRFPALMGSE